MIVNGEKMLSKFQATQWCYNKNEEKKSHKSMASHIHFFHLENMIFFICSMNLKEFLVKSNELKIYKMLRISISKWFNCVYCIYFSSDVFSFRFLQSSQLWKLIAKNAIVSILSFSWVQPWFYLFHVVFKAVNFMSISIR